MSELRTRTLGELLAADFPQRESLLAPWLTEKHLSMLYAPSGAGKSWVALSIGLAVAGGGRFLDWQALAPRKVLYVDGEMDPEDLQERAEVLLPSLDVDAAEARKNFDLLSQQDQDLQVRFPDLATDDGRDKVLKQAERRKPALVIFDNYSTLATVDDENGATSFDPILDLMRRLKQGRMASILVHHARKSANGPGSYRGTQKMSVIFNSIIALSHPKDGPAANGCAFELTFEKLRSKQGPETRPRYVALTDGVGGLAWTHKAAESEKLREVVDAVRTCRFPTMQAVADELGCGKGTVSKRLKDAVRLEMITEDERRDWFEVAKSEAAEPLAETAF